MGFKKITWAGTVTSNEDTLVKKASHLKVGDVVVIELDNGNKLPCIVGEIPEQRDKVFEILTNFKRETRQLLTTDELLRRYKVYWGKINRNRKLTEHDVWLAGLALFVSFLIPYGPYNMLRMVVSFSALALYIKSNAWRN